MYTIHPWQEFLWGLAIAVVTYLFQVLIDFDPAKITDWKAWAIALAAGCVRAAAVAGAAAIGKARLHTPGHS